MRRSGMRRTCTTGSAIASFFFTLKLNRLLLSSNSTMSVSCTILRPLGARKQVALARVRQGGACNARRYGHAHARGRGQSRNPESSCMRSIDWPWRCDRPVAAVCAPDNVGQLLELQHVGGLVAQGVGAICACCHGISCFGHGTYEPRGLHGGGEQGREGERGCQCTSTPAPGSLAAQLHCDIHLNHCKFASAGLQGAPAAGGAAQPGGSHCAWVGAGKGKGKARWGAISPVVSKSGPMIGQKAAHCLSAVSCSCRESKAPTPAVSYSAL